MKPGDVPTIDTTLAGVIAQSVAAGTATIDVSLEAEVQSYDAATCTASVIVCVQQARDTQDDGRQFRQFPKLDNVPVAWPAVASASLTLGSLEAGDRVQLVIRSRSHAEVRAGAPIPTEPRSSRRWSLMDAWINPAPAAPLPSGAVSVQGPVLRMATGKKFRIGSSTASKALALAEKVNTELQKIVVAHNGHTHTIPSGSSGSPNLTYTRAPVDSDRAFTDDT